LGGYDYDTFVDDLAMIFDVLDLKDAALFGFSMGGGEVARYNGRHGTKRLSKTKLGGGGAPLMLKTSTNPSGTPLEAFDGIRAGVTADRAQFFADVAKPYFSANRDGAKVSQGTLDCIKAFSETDFTEDLKKFDVSTLIIHGDDDQIVPIGAAGLASAKIVRNASLKIYPGAPHGLTSTHKDNVNVDLLSFLKG
jgi:non-heme chloroperoxidase